MGVRELRQYFAETAFRVHCGLQKDNDPDEFSEEKFHVAWNDLPKTKQKIYFAYGDTLFVFTIIFVAKMGSVVFDLLRT
tara:strand:+ start:1085 stop:1321 length:237 start_codon:yes stop_codon:yes gene_type:complete